MDRLKRGGAAAKILWLRYLLLVYFSWQLAVGASAQNNGTANGTATINSTLTPAEQSAEDLCVGVFLSYSVSKPVKIPPYSTDETKQPYSFDSLVTITNVGYEKLDLWELSIDFVHDEIIAEADGVLFVNAEPLPGLQTNNDTRIIGTTTPNLLTSIDTSHNLQLISTQFQIIGTEFGVNESGNPLPNDMTLVNKGYKCAINTSVVVPENEMWICCTENATFVNSTTQVNFLARQLGDIIMSFDIISASPNFYDARVSIVMNDPMGRLDHWNLTWLWTEGELIKSMKGGQVLGPNEQDLCVYGIAAVEYPGETFSQYQSCSPNPVIIDLDQDQSFNTDVAIPFCCRNGSLLPDLVDPAKTRSDVQLTVMKLTPHTTLDDITPPSNWNIGEGYTCSQPVRVSPAEFYPSALHSSSAVASWQVICNATVEPDTAPKKCCVSFSAYYNDSVVPCPTCSCGCATSTLPWNGDTCNPSIDALLLPKQAILLPPSNRTALGKQLAISHRRATPDIVPCPDNCGVTVNWHLYSDYTNGWSARMSLFNWDDQPVVDWSAAIQLPAAMPGFQDAYSFNSTKVSLADLEEFNELNNTLFMQGLIDYNTYLMEKDSADNPGKLQSILSFDKRKSPGVNVVQGDGFPTKVWFNGEECRIPDYFPAAHGWRLLPTFQFSIVIVVTIVLMTDETIRFL